MSKCKVITEIFAKNARANIIEEAFVLDNEEFNFRLWFSFNFLFFGEELTILILQI